MVVVVVAAPRALTPSHPQAAAHPTLPAAATRSLVPALPPGGALVPTSTGGLLPVDAPLRSLDARLATLAAAVAIDFDYFSR